MKKRNRYGVIKVLELAVEDDCLRKNPASNVLKELKQAHNFDTEKKKALTKQEQELFMSFMEKSRQYRHWRPVFEVMLGTGMRVGEITGPRWEDINFEEKEYQEAMGITCQAAIDGYTDFVFINRFGNVQHQGTLNKALRRIIRDCNNEVLEKNKEANPVLLPRFSCHTLRHTFATRLCETGVNVKVIQDVLGHSDIGTTMNIYADATKDLKEKEFATFSDYMKKSSENQHADKTSKESMLIEVMEVGK